ncbi:uncharacterized protein LOC114366691 isoform X2 [Ostrinia furnacalis]|uniref:uncharacterized protein LOC114366691 isoform X1 n=1 Tax=Ostrinia furnacalis TaxID=93504 RepID=UPI00103AA732|nr:uncharacterized protein LOC114366691 isoform X1 [Ostrinia furnacalis]XP_028179436.1 uncharacterized protein LOC114366691 isoform X2 [Ostrinia furnacalis]
MATNDEFSDSESFNVPTASASKPVTRSMASVPKSEDKIDLNILLKFIKQFNGDRDKLNPFIYNCQSAFNLANDTQKPILFKYMLSQLEGRAESICSIKEFETFDQFVEFLKQQFGERKHYSHLLSELQDSRQSFSETVNQFALRVETCLAKLLTEINISIPTKRKTELAGRVAALEDLALHTFMVGLQPRLSQVVRCHSPASLNAAVNLAVAEEKILAGFNKRSPQTPNNNDKRPQQPRRDFRPNNDSQRPNSNPFTCRYCKNVGHSIEQCRKRQYNNNRAQSNNNNNQQNRQFPTTSFHPHNASHRIFTVDPEGHNDVQPNDYQINQGIDETDGTLNY